MPFGQPYLITGSIRPRTRQSGPVMVAVVLFLTFMASGSYLLWTRYYRPESTAQTSASAPIAQFGQDTARDDLLLHLQNAERNLQQTLAAIKQTQTRLDLVMGVFERNYLTVEQRRLQLARQLSEQAVREAGAALEELRIADQQIKERKNHHE